MPRLIDADALTGKILSTTFTEKNMWALNLLLGLIEDAPTAGGWINVKDRIPENDRSYLTIGPRGVMRVAKAYIPAQVLKTYGGDPNYVLWTCESRFVSVTHWMPLPEPPKGDDAG